MTVAIETRGLGKQYRLGEMGGRQAYGTLRDKVAEMFSRRPSDTSLSQSGNSSNGTIWALKDISFAINEGEKVGIIGRNGAGKTTLLKILSGITEPTTGEAGIRGRVSSLLEVGTGFHGEMTGRENIFLNGAILGLSRDDIRRQFDEIVEFSGVEKFIDTPVKRYSSGMSVRLAFAVAAHLQPDILLVDEVLAVGDAEFRKKCLGRMDQVSQSGRTVVFVSHNMTTVAQLCDRGILLDQGRIISDGDIRKTIEKHLESSDGDQREATFPEDRTKPVQVTRLAVVNGENNSRTQFDRKEPFQMVVETLAHDDVEGTIYLALSTVGGTRICHDIRADAIGAYTSFKKGKSMRFAATFPGGILNEGQFGFTVWLVPPGENGSFDVAQFSDFSIVAVSEDESFVGNRKQRPDVLRIGLTWSEEEL